MRSSPRPRKPRRCLALMARRPRNGGRAVIRPAGSSLALPLSSFRTGPWPCCGGPDVGHVARDHADRTAGGDASWHRRRLVGCICSPSAEKTFRESSGWGPVMTAPIGITNNRRPSSFRGGASGSVRRAATAARPPAGPTLSVGPAFLNIGPGSDPFPWMAIPGGRGWPCDVPPDLPVELRGRAVPVPVFSGVAA